VISQVKGAALCNSGGDLVIVICVLICLLSEVKMKPFFICVFVTGVKKDEHNALRPWFEVNPRRSQLLRAFVRLNFGGEASSLHSRRMLFCLNTLMIWDPCERFNIFSGVAYQKMT